MPKATIDRLIINSPYEEPSLHWRYERESLLFSLEPGRRPAGYIIASETSKAFDDPGRFVAEALKPARVDYVIIDEANQAATAVVADTQLSLAIGKEGQNVRLAVRLTGWKIDIRSEAQIREESGEAPAAETAAVDETAEVNPIEEEAPITATVESPAEEIAAEAVEEEPSPKKEGGDQDA